MLTFIVATNQEYVAHYVAFTYVKRAHAFIIAERYIIQRHHATTC